jgi:uncharacterized SAM-binding protein YcdF (DUF218 family)
MTGPVSNRKRWRWVLAGCATLAALLLLCLFAFPQQVLCVDNGNVTGDVLVVLGGGSYERPTRAASLFREHVAEQVIITGASDHEANRKRLIQGGVPASAILIEPKADSTRENALFTIEMLRKQGARRVILVTSWYHSRRTLHCFRHYAPELQFYSRPAYFAFARSEWRIQGMYRYIRKEYLKLAGYWLFYGVCPF